MDRPWWLLMSPIDKDEFRGGMICHDGCGGELPIRQPDIEQQIYNKEEKKPCQKN